MFPIWGARRSVAKELITAVENNDPNGVQTVLNTCTALEVNYQGTKKLKKTALMQACKKGNDFIVQTILSFPDADVNLTDYEGNTALILACEEGHAEIVNELLSRHEINVNAINAGGDSALSLACLRGHTTIASLLISHPAIDVNAKIPEADAPLITAARYGRTEIVRMLVDHPKIDILAIDLHGNNAMDATRDPEIEKLLCKNGMSPTPMRRPMSSSPFRTENSFHNGNNAFEASSFQPTMESPWPAPEYPFASPQPFNTVAPFASQAEVQAVAFHDPFAPSSNGPDAVQRLQTENSRLHDTVWSLTSQNTAHLCTIQALQGSVQALTAQVASLQEQNKQLQLQRPESMVRVPL